MSTRVRFFCLQILICLVWLGGAKGQADIGLILGISNYQGDLSSHNAENGFRALIGPVGGIYAGYELSPRFHFRGDLLYTRLSGDDELNENEATRARNLDFFSPIIQLAGAVDWNILPFTVQDEKGFTPYVTGGASMFYMNPMTTYNGEKVALQPLGTEGQYLDNYPEQKPYSKFQPSLQFGGGLKLLTGSFIIALEGMLSYTFTDYIDDVSTIYISYPELLAEAGSLTAALANRQGEYTNSEPVIVPTGSLRGNPDSDDIFGTITVRLGIPVTVGGGGSKVRRGSSKTIKCPKF